MELPIKVERQKGFFSTLGTPESLEYLPAFLDEPQLIDLPGKQVFNPYLIESQGRLGERGRKLVKSLEDLFGKYDRKPIAGTEERVLIRIAVNELHCPRIPGVKAKLTVEKTQEETSGCTVKVFGVGGGDAFVTTLSTSQTLETENNCVAAIHLIPAVFEKCRMNTPDGGQIEFVQLKQIEEGSRITKGEVLNPDACQTAVEQYAASERVTFDLLNFPRSNLTEKLRIDAGSTWSGESNVSLEELGLELGAKYEATKTYSTELEYFLVEGYSYAATKPSDSASWLWSWEPPLDLYA
jgi:hypothetical protein